MTKPKPPTPMVRDALVESDLDKWTTDELIAAAETTESLLIEALSRITSDAILLIAQGIRRGVVGSQDELRGWLTSEFGPNIATLLTGQATPPTVKERLDSAGMRFVHSRVNVRPDLTVIVACPEPDTVDPEPDTVDPEPDGLYPEPDGLYPEPVPVGQVRRPAVDRVGAIDLGW